MEQLYAFPGTLVEIKTARITLAGHVQRMIEPRVTIKVFQGKTTQKKKRKDFEEGPPDMETSC